MTIKFSVILAPTSFTNKPQPNLQPQLPNNRQY